MVDNIGTRVIQLYSILVSRDDTECSRSQGRVKVDVVLWKRIWPGLELAAAYGLAPDRERQRVRVREVPGSPAKYGIGGLPPVTTSWSSAAENGDFFSVTWEHKTRLRRSGRMGLLSAQSRPFLLQMLQVEGGASLLLHTCQQSCGDDGAPHHAIGCPGGRRILQLHLSISFASGMIAGYLHTQLCRTNC